MKILIIDDQRESATDLALYLERIYDLGDSYPLIRQNPYEGIKLSNHSYDLIFVDYQFDYYSLTGADIGLEIRKRYPLTTLILVTAWGCEKILEYIHVGFDGYLEKDKSGTIKSNYVKEGIEKAILNSQKRIKSKFHPEELKSAKKRLDCMEQAFTLEKGVEKSAIATALLENGIPYDEVETNIENIYRNRKKRKVYKGVKLITSQAINRYLKVYAVDKNNGKKVFVASESALKVRQLIQDNPNKWKNIKTKHATMKRFLNEFDLM